MLTIWMFTKWYPNSDDPQLGVFIQKHAACIAENCKISVFYLHTSATGQKEFVEKITGNLHELIFYLPATRGFFSKINHAFSVLKVYREAIRKMKKVHPKPDLFHAYILLRPALFVRFLSLLKGKKYIISEQWSGYATGKYLQKKNLAKWLSQYVIKNAVAVTMVSRFLQEKMHACGLENANEVIIGNVIAQGKIVQKNYLYPLNVLLVADLVDEIKNISGVLKMVSNLPSEIKEKFRLTIIGGGKDESDLKQLAAQKNLLNSIVFFEGLKTNTEVYEYLFRSHFLIMNSRFETFSAICIEAFSCGIPVIATDCGGPSELVTRETGILIPPDDENQLKEAFLYMLENVSNYKPEAIKAYADRNFSSELAGKKFLRLYQSCLKDGPTTSMPLQ